MKEGFNLKDTRKEDRDRVLLRADCQLPWSYRALSWSEKEILKFEVVINRSLDINKTAPDIDFPNIAVNIDGEPNRSMVVANCVLSEDSILIDDVYKEENYNFSGTKIGQSAFVWEEKAPRCGGFLEILGSNSE